MVQKIERLFLLCGLAAFIICGLFTTALWANGSPFAASEMGGITFKKSRDISIETETLRISAGEIHVSYVFRSTAKEAQTIDIAFPAAVGDSDGPNIMESLRFTVTAQGKKVAPKRTVTYWQKKRDITPDILRAGAIIGKDYRLTLSESARETLKNAGIDFDCEAESSLCSAGSEWQEIFTWSQIFQPGLTRIEVSYAPGMGGDYYVTADMPDTPSHHFFDREDKIGNQSRKREMTWRDYFCIDKPVERALAKQIKRQKSRPDGSSVMHGASVSYVLETARNWNGPIKNFHLIIDKGAPDNLISFCPAYMNPPSGTKTSPTQFEWKAYNFNPEGMIRILFMYPVKTE